MKVKEVDIKINMIEGIDGNLYTFKGVNSVGKTVMAKDASKRVKSTQTVQLFPLVCVHLIVSWIIWMVPFWYKLSGFKAAKVETEQSQGH